ncbi:MAG TPA: glycerophosphoryl diester phosphodiesterase membrane domain-containing protein [Thermosynechococcus sp. M46_R2017_013]|nr:glycerophosphoryl diester phosphodiesterase membrane domain-containing protein [Thermosynechococcus sp. M46_R2017_013]
MYSQSEHTPQAIASRSYQVRIGWYLTEGWQIFSTQPAAYIGFFMLVFIINVVLSNLPVAGLVVSIILTGPFSAGYYFFGFQIARNQKPEFTHFFGAFKNNYFLPVFWTNLIVTLITNIFVVSASVLFLIAGLPLLQSLLKQGAVEGAASEEDIGELLSLLDQLPRFSEALTPVLIVVGIILLLLGIYFGVAYMFALPLVVEHQFDVWPALETSRRLISRNWWSFFFLNVSIIFFNALGLCLCGVGVLVTTPWSSCVIVAAYRDIIGLIPSIRDTN